MKNLFTPLTPMIRFTQSFFIFNSIGKIGVHKIYNYENLQELELDFNITLPYINKGDYLPENFFLDYGETEINLVRHIFLEDFVNLNYSMDFSHAKNISNGPPGCR